MKNYNVNEVISEFREASKAMTRTGLVVAWEKKCEVVWCTDPDAEATLQSYKLLGGEPFGMIGCQLIGPGEVTFHTLPLRSYEGVQCVQDCLDDQLRKYGEAFQNQISNKCESSQFVFWKTTL